VPEELLRLLLRAAVSAPDAGNLRSAAVVLCTDPALCRELGRINRSCASTTEWPDYRIEWEDGSQSVLGTEGSTEGDGYYNAPVVATIFGPAGYSYATEDSVCMAMCMLLACHALGLGACYIDRARETFATARGLELKNQWAIPKDYLGMVNIAIGYADGQPPHIKDPDYQHLLEIVDSTGARRIKPEYRR
jgi:nitroreductase